MKPLQRSYTNKNKSAKTFRSNSARTKGANLNVRPMRGGFRF